MPAARDDERVVLTVEVTDSKARYVNGLRPRDFQILEDGLAEKISTFEERENSYNITYVPVHNPNHGFRRIKVKLVSDASNYRVRHKVGYTPSQKSK